MSNFKKSLIGKQSKTMQPLWVLLNLWLIISLACVLPGLESKSIPSQMPTNIEIFSTPSSPQKANLPPALIETDPTVGSEITAANGFTLYFSEAMQPDSVERALQFTPAMPGRYEWTNDHTNVHFVPTELLTPGTLYRGTFNPGAQSTDGKDLNGSMELVFRSAQTLRVSEQIPAPLASDVDPSAAIVAAFNQPIVSLGSDPSNAAPAFSLLPAASGHGEWVNTSTYAFYPEPSLPGGNEITVTLNPQLTSASGQAISTQDQPMSWKFNTSLPEVTHLVPDGKTPIEPDSPVQITFNQSMDTTSVEKAFSLQAADNSVLGGKFTWDQDKTHLTFQPSVPYQRSATYRLKLDSAAQSSGGSPLMAGIEENITTEGPLTILKTSPESGKQMEVFDGFATLTVEFNLPLARQDFKNLIQVQPEISNSTYYLNEDRHSLYISGVFEPNREYVVKFASELKDRWNQSLKTPTELHVRTASTPPALILPALYSGSPVLFLPYGEKIISGQAVNLTQLNISYRKLTVDEFSNLLTDIDKNGVPQIEHPYSSYMFNLSIGPDHRSQIEIPLTLPGETLQQGFYQFQIQSPELNQEKSTRPSPFLLVIGRAGVTVKRSAEQAFIWAVDLKNNIPLANATISLYGTQMSQLASGQTDSNGIFEANLSGYPTDKNIMAIVGDPKSEDFGIGIDRWTNGIAGWDFGYATSVQVPSHKAYLYTDRPIYRPGQTVNFRAVVRDSDFGRYTPSNLKNITAKIFGEYVPETNESPLLTSQNLGLSAYGTASSSYIIPANAPPGIYTLRVEEIPSTEVNFQVAEYRKPEVDLQVKFTKENGLVKEDQKAIVSAQYYFGTSAANLNLHWTLYAEQDWLTTLPEGYSAGKMDSAWLRKKFTFSPSKLGSWISEGEGTTNQDGVLEIPIATSQLEGVVDIQDTVKLNLEVTTKDDKEMPVSARGSMLLHPDQFYIGVHTEQWNGTAGVEQGFLVQTVNWDGSSAGEHVLKSSFERVEWKQGNTLYSDELTAEFTPAGSTDFRTDAEGRARISFTPPNPGTYLLSIQGENAVTEVLIWVGGNGSPAWPQMDLQHVLLRTDKNQYEPGETAKIFIPNPIGQKTLALVTVERSKVQRAEVLTIDSTGMEYPLLLTDADAPNVFVSITLFGKTASGNPDFRQGYLQIEVNPKAFQLKVNLTTEPERTIPGGRELLQVEVKDAGGNPMQGEFSLSLVDKAVLALADPNSAPILEAFYGKQPLGVLNSTSLAAYGRRTLSLPLGGGGGGGGEVLPPPVVREKFPDSAYWNGTIETDISGHAAVTVNLPDNLTTWAATLRGLTKDTQVGETYAEVVVSKDLMVRPQTPRFLVAGDHVRLAAVVQNNTSESLDIEAAIQISGFKLDSGSPELVHVKVGPRSGELVSWWGVVEGVEQVDMVFQVRSGTLQDASRPDNGPLPVMRFMVPSTFATSGILATNDSQLETLSLPRSFSSEGGNLSLELSPSLAAVILGGLKAMDTYPTDFTEPLLSVLLPNVETYDALKSFGLESPGLKSDLEKSIQNSLDQLSRTQNSDGGWGWASGRNSDPFTSSYVLLGWSRAAQAGFSINKDSLQKTQKYILSSLTGFNSLNTPAEFDRLAFQYYALVESGNRDIVPGLLYDFRDRMNPWSKALLSLAIHKSDPGSVLASDLLEQLKTTAKRSATGAHWEDDFSNPDSLSSPVFSTAIVSLALAKIDPASPLLADAVRYLVTNRRASGGWASSYESAWSLTALTAVLQGTGDLQSRFSFVASLNGQPIAQGQAEGPTTLTPVIAKVPLTRLNPTEPNALLIQRDSGEGRLYYRAMMEVYRSVEAAPAVQHGLSLSRSYYPANQDCARQVCKPIDTISTGKNNQLVEVRLTLTLPESMYNVVIQDTIPAGTEIVNQQLNTTAQGILEDRLPIDSHNPFEQGWKWWLFSSPKITDTHIRWVAERLPAGTYELVYRLLPVYPGEFYALPAHAYQYYFPEVEASTQGNLLKIQ
jgi:alpha-2-macroglobulin